MSPSASPAEIAAQALRVPLDHIVVAEPIKHGLTNQSWRVRTRADVVVVRVSDADEDALRIDRDSEARILAAVAAADVGAPVIECDPARRVLVTHYLGPSWTMDDASADKNIRRLARVLRRLHDLAPPPGVRTVDLAATVEGYLATLDERGAGGWLTSQALRECAQSTAASLRRNARASLCHNDVHHLNIIDGGELHLIDWEYAGVGEPLFDLASVCVYHRYDRRRRETLLGSYSSSVDAAHPTRLELAIWLFEYIRDLWTAVREGEG